MDAYNRAPAVRYEVWEILMYGSGPGGHANVIVIDHERGTVDLFEPECSILSKSASNALSIVAAHSSRRGVAQYCVVPVPWKPQRVTRDAFCLYWSALYVKMRLKCKDNVLERT
jgi:hypothetical protein